MHRLKQKLQGSKAPDTAIEVLKQALEIFKDTAGNLGVPGLQIGVSVLSTVLTMVQKSRANTESIKELATRVEDLTKMVRESAELQGEHISAPMQDRIDRLQESWKAIDDEAQSLKSQHKVWRTLGSNKEAEVITGLVQRMSSSIQNFMVESTIAIESALNHHVHVSKQDSDRVEGKIDVMPDIIVQRLISRWEGSFVPPHAARAQFDSYSERKACLDGTRTDILETISAWAAGQLVPGEAADPAGSSTRQQPNVLWLNGVPGTGKTTISYTAAKQCHDRGILGASFFCSRSDADCSNPSMIFTTIAYRLGLFYEPYKDKVTEILKSNPDIVDSQVHRQFEELILRPLTLLRDDFPPCVVVIDALDECQQPQVVSTILFTLLEHAEDLSPLRFLVTSRPERDIVTTFDAPGYRNAFDKLLLHAVELRPVTTADIKRYLTVSLSEIRRHFDLAESWPNEADVEILSNMANGLFIFAATTVLFIGDREYSDPVGQLKTLISTAHLGGSHQLLDRIYLQVLDTAFPSISTSLSDRLKTVLGSIVVIKDPLPPTGLSRLLGLSTDTVRSSLAHLHSVLVVPAARESAENIRIIHPTFAEFLLDPSRCTNCSFTVDSQRQNTLLLRRCLDALKELKRDICDIRDPSLLNSEVPGLLGRMESAIPAHLRYACRHWCTHLSNGELLDEILDMLLEFVQRQLLHWVEACSLLGLLRDVISGINEVQRKLRGVNDDRARDIVILLNDCERLVVGYFPAISSSALHLYYSLLSFIPTKTALARTYAHECFSEVSVKVFGSVPGMWDACLGTVTAHGGYSVTAVDFSLDGRTIASSGLDGEIRIWDALTCALLLVLSSHSNSVFSVKYSPDGARIASAASDRTLLDEILDMLLEFVQRQLLHWVEACSLLGLLRDAISGINEVQRKLRGVDDDRARDIVILLNDCERLVVGYFPAISGSALQLYCSLLSLIPTKTALAQTYAHKCFSEISVKVFGDVPGMWNACLSTVTVHGGDSVTAVDFSLDGRTIASSGLDGGIRIWDALTCAPLLVLSSHSNSVFSVKYSPDGARIASAASDRTVKIWDAVSGVLIRTLEGHTDDVNCAVFTPDGSLIVSGSNDLSIKIWDAGTGACLVTLTAHDSDVTSIAVSRDGRWMASSSLDQVILWSLEAPAYTHRVVETPKGESFSFDAVAFTPDSSQILIASYIFGSKSGKLSVWDAETAKHLRDLRPSGRSFQRTCGPSFPSTGDVLACATDKTVLVWDFARGEVRQAFSNHTERVTSVAYNHDGTRIASGSFDGTVRLWDVTQPAAIKPRLENTSNPSSEKSTSYSSVAFSHSTTRALLVYNDSTSTSIEVAKTDSWGRAYKPLAVPSKHEHYVAFSPDDATILTASTIFPGLAGYHGVVALWDTASGTPRLQLEGELSVAYWFSSFEHTFLWSAVLGYIPHCFGGLSSSLMFSQDSRYLLVPNLSAAGDDHSACLWDIATGKPIRKFVGHTDRVRSVAFSLDGRRIATGSDDTTVVIWDAATGESLATCRGHRDPVFSVAFSPSGERVASGGYDHLVLVWNVEGGEPLRELEGHTSTVSSVAFAPGGDVIISSSLDKTMRLWDIESGACLLDLDLHTWYRTLHLSPDGSGVLVDDGKRLVQLWAPVDADAQVTTPLPWLPRRTWPIYYIEDDWIFSLTPSRRSRLCWLPPDWHREGFAGYCGHDVVFESGYKLNFSGLNRYLDSLHSNRTQ
ncbi:uncharacterized protein PHACADRAFT_206301 [Phanerochaete carnosa HHB-10118-sp]|uniref:Nephrocystin 3-like N-terminal domain-containing protein n=1 Tax=Phanerochaete carnosa (strain HHB-10118-sp) TaxID=650164 RepID=K5W822_PHACS|nr:uncharacterized protein PHACADRAFT_206301 [Phanerochaete carnosa HHB-10118-sp]EKM60103.1 hypothetical protein PHACADRAFT_206301 [Phanerochaete carnosa HHB-10118-sp]